jgi:gamma-glutamylcyclotransferase (GGCT)/AIG2-like uncharacterized protein YtfP
MKQYLFAYGTLQEGRAPAAVKQLIEKLKPLGTGYIQGRLYDLGDYPGAKPSKSPHRTITGTVFELPDDPAVLRDLDKYEEYSKGRPSESLFVRKKLPAKLSNGQRLTCWTYFYNGKVNESLRIANGDYSAVV